jgi:predicted nucleotidyltransferase
MDTVVADPMLRSRRTDILRIAARYGIGNVRVFGSFARGKGRPDSDLDLLVDLEPGRSLLDIIAAKQDLEDLLQRKVDVVTERSLSPYFRDSVTQEIVYL